MVSQSSFAAVSLSYSPVLKAMERRSKEGKQMLQMEDASCILERKWPQYCLPFQAGEADGTGENDKIQIEGDTEMEKKCIGIDVGGTSVKLGIFEMNGTLLDKWEIPTRKEEDGSFILRDVAASVKTKVSEMGLALSDLSGAGLGIPGPVMADGFVEVCVNLGWRKKNPQKELRELLDGLTVKTGNDANVAALGEMWQGGGMGYSDIVMVTLGTGVGGGVILDKKIISGTHAMGGEIGHIRIREAEKESCNCGGFGCLEQVASATGIAREAKRAMESSSEPSKMRTFGENITAKDVLDCAKAGDEMANQVVETVCYYLGWALSMVAMTVDPEVFVIGGGVSRAGTFLTDRIEKYFERFTSLCSKKAKITLAKLGNDAGIYGAARLILD